ncbi:LacI family DNA-binding transcriptional regulator [Actinoplanes sp. M2I2]|uniref:substrate-binding domain-containing protein n=1 Tax=Actinoplanes sp. M2I2 TaxID=1734444 RepID=UPI0020216FD7|nr:LacI family DNA-binding transcriptional regulator [Actinoplanes sp. M2I2]
MKHPYRIREIADQAGLSLATVDRVLHERGGVRASTVREVRLAMAALDRQRTGPPLPAPRFTIDLIVADPARVGAALRAELPGLRPAVIRTRLHPAADPLAALARVARSRSNGLILEAADPPEAEPQGADPPGADPPGADPPGAEPPGGRRSETPLAAQLVEAVGHLEIPVVTLGADLPASKRVAHVGLDEAGAGATAAYLVEQWLADRAGDVLVVASGAAGRRVAGFRAELSSRAPNRRLLVTGPDRLRAELAGSPSVRAVYTPVSGGTEAVRAGFAAERRNYDVFVAHGLDEQSVALLRAGRLSAVLHHDLRSDLRSACLAVLRALGAVPGPVCSTSSAVQVLTPIHLPLF